MQCPPTQSWKKGINPNGLLEATFIISNMSMFILSDNILISFTNPILIDLNTFSKIFENSAVFKLLHLITLLKTFE